MYKKLKCNSPGVGLVARWSDGLHSWDFILILIMSSWSAVRSDDSALVSIVDVNPFVSSSLVPKHFKIRLCHIRVWL
jgi:hypothetical protein